MSLEPLISVVIPAYQAELWVGAAVQSILSQTYQNLEVIVIDDASTDGTLAVLEELARRDPRLKVFKNPVNLRLIATLNRGFDLASGELIARMDADDLCPPDRLQKQWERLRDDPTLDAVSSATQDFFVRADGSIRWSSPLFLPAQHEDIVATLVFYNSFSHATCLLRRRVLDLARYPTAEGSAYYDSQYPHAEDYELWSRLAKKGVKFANLQEVHLSRRLHAESVSHRETETQQKISDRIRNEWRLELGRKGQLPTHITPSVIVRLQSRLKT